MNNAEVLLCRWEEEMIPILNGITYPDGRWQSLELISAGDIGIRTKRVKINSVVPVNFSSEEIRWTYFTQLSEARNESGSVRIVSGEGGQGADGVIAAIKADNNELAWILFFDRSNPFDKVEIRDKLISAHSTAGRVWQIALDNPSRISIE